MQTTQTGSELWAEQPQTIRQFLELRPAYEKLAEEAAYILEKSVREQKVMYAAVTQRTKSLDGFCEKVVRKKYNNPLDQITDAAGVRIVYLYSSDRPKIERAIQNQFQIVERIDRREKDSPDKFGYGALHFLVKLGEKLRGPRYDDLKDLVCEIQVRTILQDAWAIVDHHLNYKHESDVPADLRRKLNALSGLFETADDQFDRLNTERVAYLKSVRKEISKPSADLDQELNLDSLIEYLDFRYADREGNTREQYAELLGGLKPHGLAKLLDLDTVLTKTQKAFLRYERKYPPGDPSETSDSGPRKFARVGIVRVSMELCFEEYRREERARAKLDPLSGSERFDEFRPLVQE